MKIVLYSILNLYLLATASATETPKKSSKGAVPDSEKARVNHLRAGNEYGMYLKKGGEPASHLLPCSICETEHLCGSSSGETMTYAGVTCEEAGCCSNAGKCIILQTKMLSCIFLFQYFMQLHNY